jgi:hypothetical protein
VDERDRPGPRADDPGSVLGQVLRHDIPVAHATQQVDLQQRVVPGERGDAHRSKAMEELHSKRLVRIVVLQAAWVHAAARFAGED